MKRFTEATKWRDPWFSNLDPQVKLAWLWLLDNCDHAGTIDLSFKHLQFDTGYTGTEEELLRLLSERVIYINSRYFILGFLDFQYSNFETNKSRPVESAKELLKRYGILYPVNLNITNTKPIDNQSMPNVLPIDSQYMANNKPMYCRKEQEQDKEQYKDKDKSKELDKVQYQDKEIVNGYISKSFSELQSPEEIDKEVNSWLT